MRSRESRVSLTDQQGVARVFRPYLEGIHHAAKDVILEVGVPCAEQVVHVEAADTRDVLAP